MEGADWYPDSQLNKTPPNWGYSRMFASFFGNAETLETEEWAMHEFRGASFMNKQLLVGWSNDFYFFYREKNIHS